ncbi:MAG: Ig-like domain-containing protein, partial [Aeromonas salmonicida]
EADAAANKPNTEVPLGEPITIDLADKVSDVDNDALQLVNVQVFNGMVVSSFPDDMTNLKFEFSASTPGVYYVAYTVSDHKGGYASNLVQIYVAGPWPDVIVQQTGDVFAAPLSLLEAMTADLNFIGIAAEADKPAGNGDKQVPTYDWAAADAVCRARGGSLPTETQMQALMTQEGNPFLSGDGSANEMANNWPVARYYFTSSFDVTDKNKVKVWDAVNNQLQLVSSGQNGIDTAYQGYLTCIDKTPTDLAIVTPSYILRSVPSDLVAEFTTASGNRFEYTKPLYWSVSMPEVDANGFALDAKTGQPIMESDGSATPIVPEFNNNVSIEESTGIMTALADGLVNVSVTDPLGELSDTVTLKVIYNLLATDGTDPTFEVLGPGDGTCSETKHYHGTSVAGFNIIRNASYGPTSKAFTYVGCSDAPQGKNYAAAYIEAAPSVRSIIFQKQESIYAVAGQKMQIDIRFKIVGSKLPFYIRTTFPRSSPWDATSS